MGSSYVEYRGKGFWSWDGYLEHALALLADEIGPEHSMQWLADARQHWQRQSSGAFAGLVDPSLDQFVLRDEHRQVLLGLLQSVACRSDATPEVTATIQLLTALLREELSTDASSPTDYMVSGQHPYAWLKERDSAQHAVSGNAPLRGPRLNGRRWADQERAHGD